jgi:hypothetical protein
VDLKKGDAFERREHWKYEILVGTSFSAKGGFILPFIQRGERLKLTVLAAQYTSVDIRLKSSPARLLLLEVYLPGIWFCHLGGMHSFSAFNTSLSVKRLVLASHTLRS